MAWRIVHMTSVHIWHDTRVFTRMCRAIAQAGHEVHLVVPRGDCQEVEIKDGVHLHPVPLPQTRTARLWTTSRDVCRVALSLRGDIYHFHDPELIPHAWRMARQGHCVIYDAHEDVPKDLIDKHWLKPPLGQLLAGPIDWTERWAARRFAAVVAAEEAIERRFQGWARETVSIHNYPRLADFPAPDPNRVRQPWIASFGGLSRLRAIEPLVEAVGRLPDRLDCKLLLSGRCESDALMAALERSPGFRRAEYRGWLSHDEMRTLLQQSSIAMILFSPAPNNLQVRSNRFFESLASGVPVITSNFPDWKAIVEEIGCGIAVDPNSPAEIARAMEFLLTHPDEAAEMGRRGRLAIETRLNWETEQQRLLQLYARLMEGKRKEVGR